MTDKKKKVAAALAAVDMYLQEEEAATRSVSGGLVPRVNGDSPWCVSGRQEMMAMRRLVQLRVFERF